MRRTRLNVSGNHKWGAVIKMYCFLCSLKFSTTKNSRSSFWFNNHINYIKVQSAQIRQIVAKPEYIRMIGRFSNNFDTTLGSFMQQLVDISRKGGEYQSHVSNLVTRLDFNGFYSTYLNLWTSFFRVSGTCNILTFQYSHVKIFTGYTYGYTIHLQHTCTTHYRGTRTGS